MPYTMNHIAVWVSYVTAMQRACASPGLSLSLEISYYQMLRKAELPSDSHTWAGCFPTAALPVTRDCSMHIGLYNNQNGPYINLLIKLTRINNERKVLFTQ